MWSLKQSIYKNHFTYYFTLVEQNCVLQISTSIAYVVGEFIEIGHSRLNDNKYSCGTFEWRSLQLTKINNGALMMRPLLIMGPSGTKVL